MHLNANLAQVILFGVLSFAGTTNAVCEAGEVGVGRNKLCRSGGMQGPICGGDFGSVVVNNCGEIASSNVASYCGGQWKGDASVTCNSKGDAVTVPTGGGLFGWCRRVQDVSCSKYFGISWTEHHIDWCCRRV